MESLVTYNIFLSLSYVTLQVFELHVSGRSSKTDMWTVAF